MDNFKITEVCYRYDGSFYGMLTCVFESFEKKEIPVQIACDEFSLFRIKEIETDEIKAKRILSAIPVKIGQETLDYVKLCFLANIPDKEISLIYFLQEAFAQGKRFMQAVDTGFMGMRRFASGSLFNEHVNKIKKGVDLLRLEKGKFIEFVRFSDFNGVLVSVIEPEHNVLPLLVDHFAERYINDQFMIYDKTHQLALIYTDHKAHLEAVENYEMPAPDENEAQYRKLWRLFYNTVEIKERHNERCRMNHMPKKYWKNMTEFLND